MKTKTIDLNAQEWFDHKNGNSYFAGTITLNYGTETEETFLIPFQYGYGSQYEQEAKKLLIEFNKISPDYGLSLYSYCLENKIKFHSSIYEGRKKDLRNIETNYNNKLN